MKIAVLALCASLAALGCGNESEDENEDSDICVAIEEGSWSMSGECFGMEMTADVALSQNDCKFSFSNWNMAMSVPEGGEITETTIDFSGDGWSDCSGTIVNGTHIDGNCAECTFVMDSANP